MLRYQCRHKSHHDDSEIQVKVNVTSISSCFISVDASHWVKISVKALPSPYWFISFKNRNGTWMTSYDSTWYLYALRIKKCILFDIGKSHCRTPWFKKKRHDKNLDEESISILPQRWPDLRSDGSEVSDEVNVTNMPLKQHRYSITSNKVLNGK